MEGSLSVVWSQMKEAAIKFAQANGNAEPRLPRLVAVSKTKPISVIAEAYSYGQRCFGENYVKELAEKSKAIEDNGGLEEIQWHFIGHLQKNKVNNLCSVTNLALVETVDSVKIADTLNRSWGRLQGDRKLKIFVQVNTSGEENKYGCNTMEECIELVNYVHANCPSLQFTGLMTIGALARSHSTNANQDFLTLVSYRSEVCKHFAIPTEDVELSMGMSADFEEAILAGSTNIRVGSTIFGQRENQHKS
eukprot:gene11987-2570_t